MTEKTFAIINDETFQEEVLGSELPVLVGFWAKNSRPCQEIDSALEKLSADYRNRLKLVKINAGQCDPQKWLAEYQIEKIPTLILFKDGEVQCREEYEAAHPVHKFCLLLRKGIDSCLKGKPPVSLEFLKFQEYKIGFLCMMNFRIINQGNKIIKFIKLKATSQTFAAPEVKEIKEDLYDELECSLNPAPIKKGIALIDLEIECQDGEGTRFGLKGETWIYIKGERRESPRYYQKVILDLKQGGKIIGSDLSNLAKMIEGEKKGGEEIEVEPKWEPVDLFLDYISKAPPEPAGQVEVCDTAILTCQATGKKFFLGAKPLIKLGRQRTAKTRGEKVNDFVLRILPRSDSNDRRSLRISRGHLQLRYEKGEFFLKSWNYVDNRTTRNGTFIEGEPLPENRFLPLKNNTLIDIAGELLLKFTAFPSPERGSIDSARLERVNNYGEKEEYIIIVREASLGSARDNCIVIEGLSAHQAKIHYYQGGFWIENKANSGEAWVEEGPAKSVLEPAQPFPLKNGIKIRLGEQLLHFTLE